MRSSDRSLSLRTDLELSGMTKKDIVFTIGLTILMGIIWIVGELVMGLWLAVVPKVHIFWAVGVAVLTLSISVAHSMMEDKHNDEEDAPTKYERKVRKRQEHKENKKKH